MREYETTFIVQPEISDEGLTAIYERLDGILASHESVRLMYDDQGRRRLAYEIQNFQKGRYVTLMYLDDGQAVSDIERSLRLDDSMLRFLTVQVEEDVADIEARKIEAAELEKVRAQKAAERAAREAEEAARAAELAVQQQADAEAAAKAAEAAAADESESSVADGPGDREDVGSEAAAEEVAAAPPAAPAADDVKEA